MGARTRRWLPLAVAGAVVLTGTAAGLLALDATDSAGPQPWQALPSSTAGFVAVDLDPSLPQKVQALKVFTAVGHRGTDLTSAVNDTLLAGTSWGVPSGQLKRWAGSRAASAVAVDVAGSLIPTPVAVVEVKDRAKMRTDLAALATKRGKDAFGYAPVGDRYVVLSTSQDAADALAADASTSPLSSNTALARDLRALPKDRVGTAWTDLKLLDAAVATAPDNSSLPALGLVPGLGTKASAGTAAVAAVFKDGTVELEVAARGWKVSGQPVVPTTGSGAQLIGNLPTTTVAAGSAAQLGAYAEAWYTHLPKESKDQWDARAATLGLALPGDLKAAFGTQTAVAISPPPADQPGVPAGYALTSTSPDPVNAYRAVQAYGQQVAFPATGLVWDVQLAGSSVVAGTDDQFVAKTVAGGQLGRSSTFTRVLPRTDGAAVLVWADLPKLASALAEPLKTPLGTLTIPPAVSTGLSELGPVGAWVGKGTADGDSTMRVRLDLR